MRNRDLAQSEGWRRPRIVSVDSRPQQEVLQIRESEPIPRHDVARERRVDELVLSRMHTEWLVAWFYDRSRQMPPHVQERLESIGFIDGDNLTEAGRRWLQTRGPHTVSKGRHPA